MQTSIPGLDEYSPPTLQAFWAAGFHHHFEFDPNDHEEMAVSCSAGLTAALRQHGNALAAQIDYHGLESTLRRTISKSKTRTAIVNALWMCSRLAQPWAVKRVVVELQKIAPLGIDAEADYAVAPHPELELVPA